MNLLDGRQQVGDFALSQPDHIETLIVAVNY
jgi:hypothetical protein